MKRSMVWWMCVWGCVVFLSGCTLPGKRLGAKLEPLELPEERLSTLTPEEVSRRITERTHQFRTLRGWGRVHLDIWEEKYRFSEVFVVAAPDKFRLETLGALDQPVVFLVSDGKEVTSYSKKQHVVYTGVASQENIFQLSGLNLPVDEVIPIFSGNPSPLSHIDYEWGFYVPSLQRYFLERRSRQDGVGQRIWFDVTRNVVSEIQEYDLVNGKTLREFLFEAYMHNDAAYPIPQIIHMSSPLEETQLRVTYQALTVNEVLDDQTLFAFPQPQNAPIYYLDATTPQDVDFVPPYKDVGTNAGSREP